MAGDFYFCIGNRSNNLPPICDQDKNAILHVQFYGTGRNDYNLNYENVERSLLTEFLKEHFKSDFQEVIIKLTFDIMPTEDAEDFCKRALERGIYWNQRLFLFLGHSEIQLKKKCCYLLNASPEEIHQMLAKFGDFVREENVETRARKIGMLFSPLHKTLSLDSAQYRIEPDIKGGVLKSYTFTYGCGFMSPEFSSEVQKILELGYLPSAVQIRYRGIEGMLALKEDMTEVKVQFHNSMQKFSTQEENMPSSLNFLGLLDYSRPYENGYLDSQMIMLLADRGVPLENLEKLQSGYYELLEGVCKETTEYFLHFKGEFGLLEEIKSKGIEGQMKKRLKSLRNKEMEEMKKADGCTRILVPHSRVVFAVCDPYNKLKYGECYFNPTMSENEAKTFPGADKRFVVMRNSCYHPGDVRVLRLTDEKQGYENLRDCLVLPVKGPRPHAFECGGGTLGGDKFFISWNRRVIPRTAEKPCDYPLKKSPVIKNYVANLASDLIGSLRSHNRDRRNEKVRQEMQLHFATFKLEDDLPTRIDGTYRKYAAVLGPSSKECRRLGKLFYQAVNLVEDRATLEKAWLKFKEKEASLESSDDPSTPDEECSDVEEFHPYETTAARIQRFIGRSGRALNPLNANKVVEKLEANASEFVQRAQREFQKSVA